MQSLEELQANLAQYKTQAEQVQGLLALDPANEQYKQLASDLADATRLTEQLIKAQSGGGGGGGKGEAAPAGACVWMHGWMHGCTAPHCFPWWCDPLLLTLLCSHPFFLSLYPSSSSHRAAAAPEGARGGRGGLGRRQWR